MNLIRQIEFPYLPIKNAGIRKSVANLAHWKYEFSLLDVFCYKLLNGEIIIKSFLKSSVSALVLLSIAANPTPSQAENGGNGGEENPDKKSTRSLKKSSKKGKPSAVNLEEHANKAVENFSILYHGLTQSKEALQLMLFCRGIDPKMTQKTALVCKEWHDLIRKGKNDFRRALTSSRVNLKILQNTLLHPSAFVVAHEILAPDFPYQNVYSKFIQPFDSENPQAIVNLDVPKNIESFVSFMCQSPHFHQSLSEIYSTLDPLDFQTVALAAHVTKSSPQVQKLL